VRLVTDGGSCIDYLYRIREVGGGIWNEVVSTNSSEVFENLEICTTYEWQLRTKCQHLDEDDWTQYPIQIYQTPCCLVYCPQLNVDTKKA